MAQSPPEQQSQPATPVRPPLGQCALYHLTTTSAELFRLGYIYPATLWCGVLPCATHNLEGCRHPLLHSVPFIGFFNYRILFSGSIAHSGQ